MSKDKRERICGRKFPHLCYGNQMNNRVDCPIKGYSIKKDKDLWYRIAKYGKILPSTDRDWNLYSTYDMAYNVLRQLRRRL